MNAKVLNWARETGGYADVIASATQTSDLGLSKAAMKYLKTVYNMAHPAPAKHYDETRAYIIQLDEMGMLDTM